MGIQWNFLTEHMQNVFDYEFIFYNTLPESKYRFSKY